MQRPELLRNTLFIPLRFAASMATVTADMYVPDDRLFMVDDEGHVHVFRYQGRLIDLEPALPEEDAD